MRKIAALALALAMLACVAGCGQQTNDTQEGSKPTSTKTEQSAAGQSAQASSPMPIEILESGWHASEDGYVFFGVKLKNPNTNYEAYFVNLKVTGKDSDGKVVFSEDQVYMYALQGNSYYCGGQIGNGVAPDTVEFSVSVDDNDWIETKEELPAFYSISNTNAVETQYGTTSFTGELTAVDTLQRDGETEQDVCVTVVLKDEAGNIVYGTSTYTGAPKAGESTAFDVETYTDIPKYSSYEISVWGSLGGGSIGSGEISSTAEDSNAEKSSATSPSFELSETAQNGIKYLAPQGWKEDIDDESMVYATTTSEGLYSIILLPSDTTEEYSVFAEMNDKYDGGDFAAETLTSALLEGLANVGMKGENELTVIDGNTVRLANYSMSGAGDGYCAAVCSGEHKSSLVIVSFMGKDEQAEPEIDLFDTITDICGSIKKEA